MKDKKLIGSLALLLAAMLWGGSYSVQNIMSKSLGTFTVIFLKGFGGILLLIYCLITKKKITEKTILAGILVGLVNGAGLVFQQVGVATTSVSKASFISGLYVVFVPFLQLFTKKKPKGRFWWAVLIAAVGMYLLCMADSFALSYGDLNVLISAVLFALQIILIDRYVRKVELLPFVAMQQAVISLISGMIMLITEKPQMADIVGLILPTLYVMFASGLIAQILQNRYQKDVEPTVASLIMCLESVFGTFFGFLLLNQTLTPRELVGCVLMFIAIVIAE